MMSLRHYEKADIPAMRALWRRVFDEKEAYLDAFFGMLPDIGGAAVEVVTLNGSANGAV